MMQQLEVGAKQSRQNGKEGLEVKALKEGAVLTGYLDWSWS